MKISGATSPKAFRTVTACASAAVVAVLCAGPFVASASAAPNPGSPRDDYYLPENFVAPIIPPVTVTTTTIAASGTGRSGTPGAAPRTIGPDPRTVDSPAVDSGSEADPSADAGMSDGGVTAEEGGIACGEKCPEGTTTYPEWQPGPCDDVDLQLERPCPEGDTTLTTETEPNPGCGSNPALAVYQPCLEETTTTTVPDSTTSTTVPGSTTTSTVPSEEVEDKTVEKTPEKAGVLAFTGSNLTIAFLGLGVCVAGVAALVAAKLLRIRRTA